MLIRVKQKLFVQKYFLGFLLARGSVGFYTQGLGHS